MNSLAFLIGLRLCWFPTLSTLSLQFVKVYGEKNARGDEKVGK